MYRVFRGYSGIVCGLSGCSLSGKKVLQALLTVVEHRRAMGKQQMVKSELQMLREDLPKASFYGLGVIPHQEVRNKGETALFIADNGVAQSEYAATKWNIESGFFRAE